MSRYNSSGSYGHKCSKVNCFGICWKISWLVDFYYLGSNLRYPRRFSRIVDKVAAIRFCKKWNLKFEEN